MKTISFIFFMLIILSAIAENNSWILLPGSNDIHATIQATNVKSDLTSTKIKFNLGAYSLKEVNTPNGIEYIVEAPKAARILKKGAPDLPLYAKSVIIPDLDNMEVEILNSKYIEIQNIKIAPSKGNLLRTINPHDVPYTYGLEYQQNAFYPSQIAYLREPYILRDFRGQPIVFQPVQYNPVTRTLRIYYEIEVEVKSTGNIGINIFQRPKTNYKIDQDFHQIYKRHFVNYDINAKYTPLSDLAGNMLIICYDNFLSAMQPFVEWKIMKGIPTEIVPVSTIGNNANSIKSFVANYYNTKGLVYLLLVGDFAQVTSPTANIGGVTGAKDNEYGYILGNDHYQEIFVGRFSAESVADVQTQVERSIYYEKILSNGDWLAANLGIGSDQGPGDDNEYDYQHIRNMQTDLMNFTYTTRYELFDGSQGGLDASGNPTASNVSSIVNPGIGSILYCGHGADNQWVTTGFSNTNVSALTNINKLPFIYSVSCVIGHYNAGTCFCEAWMRSKQSSGPVGAIGIFGSTINQSWNPPMQAQDEMIDILVESYANNIKRTFAGIAINGCFKMNDESADFDMTDTWTVFGDPSLMIRTKSPMTMTVSHPSTITVGTTSVDVNCNVQNAYIAITHNNQILGTGYVLNGVAHINFPNPPNNVGDTLIVCATAFNYVTYIGTIEVIANNIPVDAQLLSISEPQSTYYCENISVTPKIILRNQGINNLTSAIINYQIDGGTVVSTTWTGNLATNQSDTINLTPFVLTNGTHTFYAFVSDPNNTTDGYPSNNDKTITFTVIAGGITSNFTASNVSSCTIPFTVTFTNLSQNTSDFTWDFGDGTTSTDINPVHTYTSLGVYTVSLVAHGGICGDYTETKTNYIQIGSTPPVVQDTYACYGSSVQLNANASGTIYWYNSPIASNPINTGNTLTITHVTQNDTFWVENLVIANSQFGGSKDTTTNGSYFNNAYEHYLVFDCTNPVTLISVKVNAASAGNRTIQLRDANNNVLQSATVYIPQGISRVQLNFSIPVGTDLRLVGPIYPNLWRNNDGCTYPYQVGNEITIKYSSASTNPTGYYYYFYDWEIKGQDCYSERIPVKVLISQPDVNITVTNESFPGASDASATAIVNGNGPFTYVWSDGQTTPSATNLTEGVYTVTITDIYGCSTVQTVNIIASGIYQENTNTISIYPNPVTDKLYLDVNTITPTNILITSVDGRIVSYNTLQSNNCIDVSSIKEGLYFIEIQFNNQRIKYKFVKN